MFDLSCTPKLIGPRLDGWNVFDLFNCFLYESNNQVANELSLLADKVTFWLFETIKNVILFVCSSVVLNTYDILLVLARVINIKLNGLLPAVSICKV